MNPNNLNDKEDDMRFSLPDPEDVNQSVGGGDHDPSRSMFRSVPMAMVPSADLSPFGAALSPSEAFGRPTQHLFPLKQKNEQQNVAPDTTSKLDEGDAIGPFVWKLTALRRVPRYHPIERGSLTLEGIPIPTISERVSGFLHRHSISCSYNESEPGRVDCLTDSLLHFALQLWQGIGSRVIIEVTRRQGCPMEMQGLKQRLYHAVELGGEESASPAMDPTRATAVRIHKITPTPEISMADVIGEETFPEPLDICFDLMNSRLLDQNRLGLESLCIMTDPLKVHSQGSDKASRVLIFGDEESGDTKLRDIFEEYFSGIELNARGTHDAQYSLSGNNMLRYAKGLFFGASHLLALRVLANALESIAWQRERASGHFLTLDLNSQFWRKVVGALVYNLEVAVDRPMEAALSIKCIRLLQGLEPTAFAGSKAQLLPYLENAKRYGQQHHLWLQQESEQLMGRFAMAH